MKIFIRALVQNTYWIIFNLFRWQTGKPYAKLEKESRQNSTSCRSIKHLFMPTSCLQKYSSQYIGVVDQAWGQDGWILAKFFFCVFMDRDEVEVHKHAKRRRPISSHLDRTSLVNKGFIIWDKTLKRDKFSLRDIARIPSGQDSSIWPARAANHSARFGSSCPLAKLVV